MPQGVDFERLFSGERVWVLGLGLLMALQIYRRIRRNFGRQPLKVWRLRLRIGILLIVGALLTVVALLSAAAAGAAVGGAALGVALATWAARRTRFEMHENQLHYVPHTVTGVAITVLLLARVGYRLLSVSSAADPANAGLAPASLVSSPLTLGLFFVLVGYYCCYYGWLLQKSQHLSAADFEDSARPA
jgi:uncharacterized membrane protein HdeD (DUF308 family)